MFHKGDHKKKSDKTRKKSADKTAKKRVTEESEGARSRGEKEEQVKSSHHPSAEWMNALALGVYAAKEEEEIKEEDDLFESVLTESSMGLEDSSSDTSRRSSVQLAPGRRIDKRISGAKHTVIVSMGNNEVPYQLMKIMDEEEANALFEQTRLRNIGKMISGKGFKGVLGQGHYGRVILARNQDGDFLAVKKINEPEEFKNEYIFLVLLEKKGIKHVMPVYDTLTLPNSKGQPTIYQFMPLANLGSGKDLLLHWNQFTKQERKATLRHLTHVFFSAFSSMEDNHIYHTDFKLDNFLLNLSKEGVLNIYISDFGTAVLMDGNDHEQLIVGKKSDVLYFPPEKLANKNEHGINHLTDVYRMQESWRLGLTLLWFANPEMALKYVNTALYLVDPGLKLASNQKNYAAWLEKFAELHNELKVALKEAHVSYDIRHILVGLLEPKWENRLTIKEAQKKLDTRPVDEHEMKAVSERLLALRGGEHETEKEKEKKKREPEKKKKHVKKGSRIEITPPEEEREKAKHKHKHKHKHHKSSAILFKVKGKHDKKHGEEKEKKSEKKTRSEIKKLSLKDLGKDMGRATSDYFHKLSPRFSPHFPPRSKSGGDVEERISPPTTPHKRHKKNK